MRNEAAKKKEPLSELLSLYKKRLFILLRLHLRVLPVIHTGE